MTAPASGPRKYFFAYARKDSDFVLRLAKDLRAAGVRLWLDQLDVIAGQRWDRAVEEALKQCEGMIAVLSPDAIASHNVMDEVSYALEEGRLVVPVLLRAADMPFRLRRVQYVDFTADYDAAFERLLRAVAGERPVSLERESLRAMRQSAAAKPAATAPPLQPEMKTARAASQPNVILPRVIGALAGAGVALFLRQVTVPDGLRDAIPVFDWRLLGAGALAGAIAGNDNTRIRSAVLGVTAAMLLFMFFPSPFAQYWALRATSVGTFFALAGAIAGSDWRRIAAAIGGYVLLEFAASTLSIRWIGPAYGAVLGAVLVVAWQRRRSRAVPAPSRGGASSAG